MYNADGKPAGELSMSDTAAGPPFSKIKRRSEVFPLLATRKIGGCEPMERMLIFAPWERRRLTSSVLECVIAVMRGVSDIGGAMSTSTLLVDKRALTAGTSSKEVARWRQVCPLQGRWLGSALWERRSWMMGISRLLMA